MFCVPWWVMDFTAAVPPLVGPPVLAEQYNSSVLSLFVMQEGSPFSTWRTSKWGSWKTTAESPTLRWLTPWTMSSPECSISKWSSSPATQAPTHSTVSVEKSARQAPSLPIKPSKCLFRLSGTISNSNSVLQIHTVMVDNIEKILDRGDRISLLVDKTSTMQDSAFHFRKQSKRLRRALWMKNAKLLWVLFLFLLWISKTLYIGRSFIGHLIYFTQLSCSLLAFFFVPVL